MRPLNYNSTITVRTDAGLRHAIDAAARREGASASDWVRRALAATIQPDDPPPPPVAPAVTLPVAA